MPVKIQDALPATAVLQSENIFVITEHRASHQDIRPLRIAVLNLMPTKIATETQILRCLSNTPLQIEIDLVQTHSYTAKNTSSEHLNAFYTTFDEIKCKKYDGMIITGAPVEHMEFEEVDYWEELKEIMEWTKTNVYSTLHICWASQAGLFYHYGVKKHELPHKMFGVFSHTVLDKQVPICRGFDDVFFAPHSRHTTVLSEDIEKIPSLEIIAESPKAGVYMINDRENRRIFVTGHPEYDADTLGNEYFRDIGKGLKIDVPENYFEDGDPAKPPVVTWRAHANLFYSNWLNYYVYQMTPFNLETM